MEWNGGWVEWRDLLVEDDWCKCDSGVQVPFHTSRSGRWSECVPQLQLLLLLLPLYTDHIASTVRLNLTSNQAAAAATAAKEEQREKVFRVVFYTFDSVEHHLATWDVGWAQELLSRATAQEWQRWCWRYVYTSITFLNWSYHYNSWGLFVSTLQSRAKSFMTYRE